MSFVELLQRDYSQLAVSKSVYKPLFFRLTEHSDRQALSRLAQSQGNLQIYDTIEGQLIELIKTQHPSQRFTQNQLSARFHQHIGSVPLEEYGVWVYYPWSDRLVHILDEKEFIQLRTSRNQYKITPEEQDILARQKIGIIGLSVGQSIALTMAMERTFGEVRLADFDSLELTNMNRIRTGVHNLGVSKVVTAAREIAEIDPFLRVECFIEGITEENMDRFLLERGKLDILVDECDNLDIKIICRQRAKALQIPVVMDTSDRGLVDVERFDLEPDRPILHGLIPSLNAASIKQLTPQERLDYILTIVGKETLSERAKRSLPEIGRTITTWPQLASAVMLGAAVTTDVCRRISLGELQKSGRYYIDLHELIKN